MALLVLGAALAGAAILHAHRVLHTYGCAATPTNVPHSCLYISRLEKPGWADPLALGISLFGLAAAAGTLAATRRRS